MLDTATIIIAAAAPRRRLTDAATTCLRRHYAIMTSATSLRDFHAELLLIRMSRCIII